MAVLFLFVDGLGIGPEGHNNPVMNPEWKALDHLSGGQGLSDRSVPVQTDNLVYLPVDATLGVEGLPQSGTGQTALFTGVNAARIAGRHYGPIPHSSTKHLIEKESLFHKFHRSGGNTEFVNAYPDRYLQQLERTGRWNCTALMARSSGHELNGIEEVQNGEALTAEIDQKAWREYLGLPVGKIEPEEAAERMLKRAEEVDLLLFEYYLTDKVGHDMDVEKSKQILGVLDRFVKRLLKSKTEDDYLVLCSDHGNLEDLTIKTHTRNPVPFMVYGRGLSNFSQAHSIMDVTERILSLAGRGRAEY